MIPSREILNYLHTTPFRRFQIRMTGGKTYDIKHPEMIRVGKNSLIVFTFVSDFPEIYDRWETVSLLLIEAVEFLDASVPKKFGDAGVSALNALADFITAEPFHPFCIQMASGRSIAIRHPEMIEVGKNTITVYTSIDATPGAAEQWHKISLMLIEYIEPMQTAAM